MTKKQLEAENKRLRNALLALVYKDRGRWYAGVIGDSDVTDDVGRVLKQ